jgi:hypothetical protein
VTDYLPRETDLEDRPTVARAPRSPKGGKVSKVSPEEQAARGRVLAADRKGYLAARGVEPLGERLPADALRLVRAVGGDGDVAVAVVDAAYADPYWRTKVTLADIASKPDRFRGASTPAKTRPRPQSNEGARWSANYIDLGEEAAS